MNYKLLIQYDGTKYNGWQKQGTTSNTIQYKIEQILSKMTESEIQLHGSGRTDAGVHAHQQVAHFKCEQYFDTEFILDYINRYLPKDICVYTVKIASERFHSRLNVIGKRYLYRIHNSTIKNVFERNYVTTIETPLNVEKMKIAANSLIGNHDFKSFCSNPKMKKSTIRKIHSIEIEKINNEIQIIFYGNGFLQHMVRIIVGTLIEVGLEKSTPESLKDILESKNRRNAGPTAPAQGLTLLEVLY